MWYKVFKNEPQALYMLEMAEKDTGQLLLVSDTGCAANFWLNPYSKASGNLHRFSQFKLIDFHICI